MGLHGMRLQQGMDGHIPVNDREGFCFKSVLVLLHMTGGLSLVFGVISMVLVKTMQTGKQIDQIK